jgi:hypothetical protein
MSDSMVRISNQLSMSAALSDAFAGAKAEPLRDRTPSVSQISGGVIVGVCGAALAAALIIYFIRRPKLQQEQEEEESAKRPLPEPLLNELEYESPLTLAGRVANVGFEPGDDAL